VRLTAAIFHQLSLEIEVQGGILDPGSPTARQRSSALVIFDRV